MKTSSVPLMFPKMSIASAEKPAGPVTFASRPPGRVGELRLDVVGRVDQTVGGLGVSAARVDRGGQQRGRAVPRDDRRDGLADSLTALGVDRRARAVDRRAIGGGQTALATKDRDRIGLIGRREVLQRLQRLDGFRAARQIIDRLVLLRVLELARQRTDRDGDQQPDTDHGELRAAPSGHPEHRPGRVLHRGLLGGPVGVGIRVRRAYGRSLDGNMGLTAVLEWG